MHLNASIWAGITGVRSLSVPGTLPRPLLSDTESCATSP